jgi:hypothetical protein
VQEGRGNFLSGTSLSRERRGRTEEGESCARSKEDKKQQTIEAEQRCRGTQSARVSSRFGSERTKYALSAVARTDRIRTIGSRQREILPRAIGQTDR